MDITSVLFPAKTIDVMGSMLNLFLFILLKAEKICEILLIYQLILFPEKNPQTQHLNNFIPYTETVLSVSQDRVPVTIANYITLHFFLS